MRVLGGLLVCLTVSAAPALQADDPAQALVDKAIKAAGGKDKVAKLHAGTCKGKIMFSEGGMDIMITIDVSWQGLKHFRLEGEVQAGGKNERGIIVLNGDKAWMKQRDKTMEIPKEIAPILKGAFYAVRLPHLLADLKGKDFKVAVIGEAKVGDRPAIAISVNHADHKDVAFYFDKENGLPLKSEIRVSDPNGKEITIEYGYQEYKETDGLKHCTKVAIKADGKEFACELSEIRPQGTLDAIIFAEPK